MNFFGSCHVILNYLHVTVLCFISILDLFSMSKILSAHSLYLCADDTYEIFIFRSFHHCLAARESRPCFEFES